MLVKLPVKAKDFIYIYSSCLDLRGASCLVLAFLQPGVMGIHTLTCCPAAIQDWSRGGQEAEVFLVSTSEGRSNHLSPYFPGLWKSSKRNGKALPKSSDFKQSGVWL